MSIKRYKPEQIVTLLRQIEVEITNGKTTTPKTCTCDVHAHISNFYKLFNKIRL